MRRLVALVLVAGCSSSAGTSIVVTVTGSVPAFDHLAITLSANAGSTTHGETLTQSSIPPDAVFGIDVPRAVHGPLHVQVDAVDASGTTLATDAGDVPLAPGKLQKLMLTLGTQNADGSADDLRMPDLGMPGGDLSLADLSMPTTPPDLIPSVVALGGTRPLPALLGSATRQFVDLDGDGKLDILDTNSSQFQVVLNRGDGVFGTPVTISAAGLQTPPLDLNGDGLLDLVSVSGTTLAVFLNNGKGVYPATGVLSTLQNSVQTSRIVDLNKDGFPDVFCIVAGAGGKIGNVFLNNKSGAFPATPSVYSFDPPGQALALIDTTGDGTPEVLVGVSPTQWENYFNDGAGGFAPTPSPAPSFNNLNGSLMQFQDLNGDNRTDAVVSNGALMSVILANTDGTFGALNTFSNSTTISSFVLANLNGDTKPDILTRNSSNQLSVMLNNGLGGFGGANMVASTPVTSQQIVDLTGDGRPEIVALESAVTVAVYINDGNGGFGTRTPYGIVSSSAVLQDLNGDSKLDLVTVGPTSFGVALNNGAGAFGARADTTVPSAAQLADINGDGKLDAWGAGGANNVLWYSLNDGHGVFAPPISTAMASLFSASSLASFDLTGDGRADLLGGNSYVATTTGVPDLPELRSTDGGTPTAIVIGDFKTDGRPDIVATFNTGVVGSFVNNGDGTFANERDFVVGTSANHLAMGHVKSPTNLDIVVSNGGSSNVSLLTGRSDGTFDPKLDYPVSTTPYVVALADLNGDTYDDLAVMLATNNVGVLLNNGAGLFGNKNDYPATGINGLLAANLNSDKYPDLVTWDTAGANVLTNDGAGHFPANNNYTWTSSTVSMVRLIDLTTDNLLDMVASVTPSAGTAELTLRSNNGNGTFAMNPTNLVPGALFAFGDFNRDGRADLVVTPNANTVRILLQDSSGNFVPASEYYVPSSTFIELADLNGDGLAEVICGGGLGTELLVMPNLSR